MIIGVKDLPPHIVLSISHSLDSSSCLNLGLTCKELLPNCEKALWTDINLSFHQSNLTSTANSFGKARLLKIQQAQTWRMKYINNQTTCSDTDSSYTNFMQDLLNHLKLHPRWMKHIRRITVDIDKLLCEPFVQLLRLTSKTLTSLQLLHPEYPFGCDDFRSLLSPLQIFQMLHQPLTNLRHLQITLEDDWQDTLHSGLLCMPHVRSLTISSASAYAGGWGRKTMLDLPDGRCWPIMKYLKRLEVDEMYPELEEMVTNVLLQSKSIQYVALRDPADRWKPSSMNPVVLALKDIKHLDYLALNRKTFDIFQLSGNLPSIDILSISDDRLKYNLSLLQGDIIPPCDTMSILYLHGNSTLPPITTSFAWDEEVHSLPAPVRSINPTILADIEKASKLQLILFPAQVEDEYFIHEEYLTPEESLKKVGRGITLRTYTSTDDQHTFTHCTSYTAHHTHVSDSQAYPSEDIQEEYTDYDGCYVDANTLGNMYQAVYKPTNWTEGGRGLDLPEQAWRILKVAKDKVVGRQEL